MPKGAHQLVLGSHGARWGLGNTAAHKGRRKACLSIRGLHSHRGPQTSTQTGATGHMRLWGGGAASQPPRRLSCGVTGPHTQEPGHGYDRALCSPALANRGHRSGVKSRRPGRQRPGGRTLLTEGAGRLPHCGFLALPAAKQVERQIILDTLPGLLSAEELEGAHVAAGLASTSHLAVTCGRFPRATGQGVHLLSQVSRGAGPVQMQPPSFTSQHRYGLQAPHCGPTWGELLPALGEVLIHDSQGPLPSTSPSTSSTQSTRSESRKAHEVSSCKQRG